MRMSTYLTSACLMLLGTIALAQSVTYDYDRAANFSHYKTYAWTRGTELTAALDHVRGSIHRWRPRSKVPRPGGTRCKSRPAGRLPREF